MAGRDILARSRTGTGKTLAFALPIIESIGKGQSGRPRPSQPLAIVLVPTRELAKQVASEFELLARPYGLQSLAVYGGAPMGPQIRDLRRGVHVVVGTPGRILDHCNSGALDLSAVKHAVLDEVSAHATHRARAQRRGGGRRQAEAGGGPRMSPSCARARNPPPIARLPPLTREPF